MNYYIADTHFGHGNCIRFDHRPFADAQQMEETMVMLWNAAVLRPEDTVYIVGDFCWGKADEWMRILRKLRGNKVLIHGNHDLTEYPPELRRMFVDIVDYAEVVDQAKDGTARKVILSHYPMPCYKRSANPKYYMLYGHVHNSPENDLMERWTAELREAYEKKAENEAVNCGQLYNVGCMMPWMEYTPRTLDEIVRRSALAHGRPRPLRGAKSRAVRGCALA